MFKIVFLYNEIDFVFENKLRNRLKMANMKYLKY